ncbi:MAG: SpoIIIAH-like family protein [Clostridiales bacterium]|nr:SpoIIIAH-like family protein [Clostridiales bacterium]
MKLFKRNAIILTVVMFLCVAVYLNWSYNKNHNEEDELSPEDVVYTEGSEDMESESGLIYQEEQYRDAVSEYFADARLTRQQARDSAITTLQEAAKLEGATQEAIDSTMNEITVMAAYSLSEAEIETLIKAKGFDECVVFLKDESAIIAVQSPQEGLSTSAVSRIMDTVLTETDLTTDQIKIIEIKK